MEVILKQDVDKLGYKDELIKVRDGFGRNYLIPKKLAIVATPEAKKMLTETLKQRSFKEARIKSEAEKVGEQLKKISLMIGAKVGENGKIFGSINTIQIADALKKLGHVIDRKKIAIKGDTIKSIGNYKAEIELHKDLKVLVDFEVAEE